MLLPSINDIWQARERIHPYVKTTPVLWSAEIDAAVGCSLLFKCENFQKAGAFKFRGACNAVFSLNSEEAGQGVATHSSGNHAAALSYAARLRGIPAYIVMPRNSSPFKIRNVERYGGKITFCENNLQAREDTLTQVLRQTGACFVHPYDNPLVIAGQGTACIELLEECPDIEAVFVPVGGGGLMSGTAVAAKGLNQATRVYACEPAGADDAFRSFVSGRLIPQTNPQTIADGLRTSLSQRTFALMLKHTDGVFTVSEESIRLAVRMLFEELKVVAEPSAAVTLAAFLEQKAPKDIRRAACILSGGNMEYRPEPAG